MVKILLCVTFLAVLPAWSAPGAGYNTSGINIMITRRMSWS